MPESDELSKDIREIKWHQEEIDSSLEMLLRANKENLLREVLEMFGRSKRRARVYLAVDGIRNVGEIASDEGIHDKNVYNELKVLKRGSLIVIKGEKEKQLVFKKSKLDHILNLSKILRKKFSLD
jgi:hypothetical protein